MCLDVCISHINGSMTCVPRLEDFFVSQTHGFLLERIPSKLEAYYDPWERLVECLPDLIRRRSLRDMVHEMALLDPARLHGYAARRRARMLLGFLCNGYVWQDGDKGVPQSLPRQLSLPLWELSCYLGVPPTLTHSDFALSNWKLIDDNGPFVAENLCTICRYPGGRQFEWFTVITVEIERKAGPGIQAAVSGLAAVQAGDDRGVLRALASMRETIETLRQTLNKMHVGLESDVFFNVFRPFLSGWGGDDSPLPDGLVYEGVSEHPIKVIGASAAQSSIFQFFDAVLGLLHSAEKQTFLDTMLAYMPRVHREFLLTIRQQTSFRAYVHDSRRVRREELVTAYNSCVRALSGFRSDHIQIVTKYIVIPSKRGDRNQAYESVAEKGTGGTALIPFLQNIRDSTLDAQVSSTPMNSLDFQ